MTKCLRCGSTKLKSGEITYFRILVRKANPKWYRQGSATFKPEALLCSECGHVEAMVSCAELKKAFGPEVKE